MTTPTLPRTDQSTNRHPYRPAVIVGAVGLAAIALGMTLGAVFYDDCVRFLIDLAK